MIRFVKNGVENNKTTYLVQRKLAGVYLTIATIFFEGGDWILKTLKNNHIDRFEKLNQAKNEGKKL